MPGWAATLLAHAALLAVAVLVPSLAYGCAAAILLLTATTLTVGAHRHGRVHRRALLAMAGGTLLYLVSLLARAALAGQMGAASLWAQAFGLPAFALMIWGPLRMAGSARTVKNDRRRFDLAAVLDSALMAVGAAATVVTLLVLPLVNDPSPKSWDALVSVSYPVLNVVFLLAVTYLGFLSRPGRARRMFMGSGFALFAGDIAQSYNLTHGGDAAWASLPYFVGFALISAAAVDRSVADLGFGLERQSQSWSPWRVAVLGGGLLAPAVLLVTVPGKGPEYRATYAAAVTVGSLLVLARAVRAINDYARTHAALRLQAERDPLTGLANRTAFLDRVGALLEAARQHGGTVSVLFVDLDGFKAVNDTRGHATGDLLLAQVTRRLRAALRSDDFAARLGGDEFALVTADDAQGAVGERLAHRVHALFTAPFTVGTLSLPVTAAVGLANSAQMPGKDAGLLIGAADAAMYQAKRAGSGTWLRAGAEANADGAAAVAWSVPQVLNDRP